MRPEHHISYTCTCMKGAVGASVPALGRGIRFNDHSNPIPPLRHLNLGSHLTTAAWPHSSLWRPLLWLQKIIPFHLEMDIILVFSQYRSIMSGSSSVREEMSAWTSVSDCQEVALTSAPTTRQWITRGWEHTPPLLLKLINGVRRNTSCWGPV